MAIPTEYNDNATSIGCSNIKHPIISFKVIVKRQIEGTNGPITNSNTGTVLHPDMHDSDADRGRTASNNHENNFSTIIPGFLAGSNIVRNDDDTFTAYGQKALYLKKEYADIANPLLEVTNSPPYTVA